MDDSSGGDVEPAGSSPNTVLHGTAKNMPEEPPNKKLKHNDLQSRVEQEKQTARDGKSGETSHKAQVAEGKTHTFKFCIRNEVPNNVVCDASKTVFGALNENVKFERNNKEGKEIIIRRSPKYHEAAVKTDFPSCLIEDGEKLQINFYKNKNIPSTNQETTADTDPERLVTFYIRTIGVTNKKIMKSSVFSNKKIDYVCVFTHKEDTFEKALRDDGRFSEEIFEDDCNLVDDEKHDNGINMKVAGFAGKKFKLKLKFRCKTPQALVLGHKNDGESDKLNQQPASFPKEEKTNATDPSTEGNATQSTSGNSSGDSGNSFFTEIQSILQAVLKDVLKQQKKPRIQELLQKEYDKGVDSFTEVNKVKQVMDLSDSVCVIVVEDTRGTGFLLFDRFILTNAHVVEKFVVKASDTYKLSRTLKAVFNYEFLGSEVINLQAKSELIAYRYEKDAQLRWHDYALLELEAAPDNCTELLTCYKHDHFPNSGGIYIVGHPDCDVKKMDLCFIIGEENQLLSINQHISENVSCPYVSWQCWPYLYKNRITYDSCFFHGSSGSPVFDAHCNLISMHTGGFDYKQGEITRSVIEFSYSMQSIMESIIAQVRSRSDIMKLLQNEKFKHIKENFDLGKIEDACEANIPIKEEQQTEEEKMEEN